MNNSSNISQKRNQYLIDLTLLCTLFPHFISKMMYYYAIQKQKQEILTQTLM